MPQLEALLDNWKDQGELFGRKDLSLQNIYIMVIMEIKEWITILSVIALIVGWFTNSRLNRRNEIAKERLKYRMDTLRSIIDLLSEIQDCIDNKRGDITHLKKQISDVSYKFDIYGKEDEQRLWKLFIKAINEKGKTEQPLNDVLALVKSRIRHELHI